MYRKVERRLQNERCLSKLERDFVIVTENELSWKHHWGLLFRGNMKQGLVNKLILNSIKTSY